MNFRKKNLFLGPLITSPPCIIIIVKLKVKCDFWVLFTVGMDSIFGTKVFGLGT